ncbi:putative cinnamyl-alcohol dehydrogenase [Lupinus albus]|uniref:Putative cinnamyl-alcohol dehydrogenase n=1 Tax=Lupinus albus TaxID=3870 RepID=A0A6A4R2J5_LUPAL|nr:putative cinnamyl-alcohol dehydrogenase [Lupinus albus]
MNSNTGEGKVVCVTGASGYIASWIVKFLLHRGYTVRATVRDPSNPKKVEHLLELDGANERLQLFKADLLQESSFDSVIQGCDAVFHTASPVIFTVNDPQAELVNPAVKGTLNILKSCVKSPSVKRVVLTSSIVSVLYNSEPLTPEAVVDDTWFSDPHFFTQHKWQPYILSKTLAENAAWKFVKENNIDMVTIHPALVIGPLLQPELNATSELVLNLINGTKTFPNTSFGWINVEDVANAHIQAYEIPSASGRYCLSERVLHYSDIVNILKNQFPTLPIADKCEDDEPYAPTYEISKEKTKSLGIEFIPFEVSLRDIVESLKEKKFVNF